MYGCGHSGTLITYDSLVPADHVTDAKGGSSSRLTAHSLAYLLARGLPGVINFLAIAVYTRLLDPAGYGEYSLVLAGVVLADAVIFQWLRLALLRFLPAAADRSGFLQLVLTVFTSTLPVLALLTPLGALFFPVGLLLSGMLLLVTQAWFEMNLELVRTDLNPRRYGLVALVRSCLSLAFATLFLLAGTGAAGLLLGLSCGMLVTVLLLREFRNWPAPRRASLRQPAELRRLLVYGLPLSANFALAFVVSSSDRFLIGAMLGTEATGLYSAGYDLAQFTITMVLTVVNLAAYPLIVAAMERHGTEAARERLRESLPLLLAAGLPVTAGLAMLAGPIAGLVTGAEFAEAAGRIIPWIAVGALLAGLKAYYVDLAFQLGRNTVLQAGIMLGAAVLNIILNLLLIPVSGIMGAVHATVIVYAAALVAAVLLSRVSFRLPGPGPRSLAPVLATALMIAVLLVLPAPVGTSGLIWQVAAAGSVYVATALLLWRRLPV